MSFLLIFAGKAGTGKTTLARSIAEETGTAYIDYDTLCQSFLEAIEEKDGLGDDDRYGFYRIWRKPCYDSVKDIMVENLSLGVSLIVSAPFTRELQDENYIEKLKTAAGKDFSYLLCYMAPEEEKHFEMIKERDSRRDEDFINNKERFSTTFAAEEPKWEKENTLILTSGNFETNKEIVIKRVNTLRRHI